MKTAWFINECGEVYDYDVATQAEEFPDDDHTPYPTKDAAEEAVILLEALALSRRKEDEWEVFLCDTYGFTQRDDEWALRMLSIVDDLDAVHREIDDELESIVICRGKSKPKPQSPGEEERALAAARPPILRLPSSRRTIDFIELDVRNEDPERALLLWHAAQGAATRLNEEF